MKHSLLYITLLSTAAMSQAGARESIQVGEEALANAVAVSTLLDADVQATDDRRIGEFGDILFNNNGQAKEFLVEFDDLEEEYNRGATTFRDDVADYGEPPLYQGESNEQSLQLDYVAVPPAQIAVHGDPGDKSLVVDFSEHPIAALPQRDHGVSRPYSGIYASDMLGMEVVLDDAVAFGEVEEVLLDASGRNVLAYVIDHRDGLDRQRVALPAREASFQRAEKENAKRENYGVEALAFPYSVESVQSLPEFDLEPYQVD